MSDLRNASPVGLLELGFALSYEAQKEHHKRWRRVMKTLEAIRGDGVPHDAGDHDVYFDLVLRQMEDEQADYMRKHSTSHPEGRTRMQIQLTRYWITSVGEVLRATRGRLPKGGDAWTQMTAVVDRFGAFRMMIAKQQVAGSASKSPEGIPSAIIVEDAQGAGQLSCVRAEHPDAYQVKPIINRENGSVCFPVYDGKSGLVRSEDRRALSDYLLEEFKGMPLWLV